MPSAVIVVMLIRVGSGSVGGPAVVQGFETLAACERAKPRVEAFYGEGFSGETMRAACVALPMK